MDDRALDLGTELGTGWWYFILKAMSKESWRGGQIEIVRNE